MKWSGKQGYNDAPVQKWHSDFTGKHAGDVRTFQNLTFLRVFEAGHMVKCYIFFSSIFKLFLRTYYMQVPYDQPENSLDFFNKWLNSSPLASD